MKITAASILEKLARRGKRVDPDSPALLRLSAMLTSAQSGVAYRNSRAGSSSSDRRLSKAFGELCSAARSSIEDLRDADWPRGADWRAIADEIERWLASAPSIFDELKGKPGRPPPDWHEPARWIYDFCTSEIDAEDGLSEDGPIVSITCELLYDVGISEADATPSAVRGALRKLTTKSG